MFNSDARSVHPSWESSLTAPNRTIGGASRWAILVLFKSATIKYGALWQEGKNGRFYEAKVALHFDL